MPTVVLLASARALSKPVSFGLLCCSVAAESPWRFNCQEFAEIEIDDCL